MSIAAAAVIALCAGVHAAELETLGYTVKGVVDPVSGTVSGRQVLVAKEGRLSAAPAKGEGLRMSASLVFEEYYATPGLIDAHVHLLSDATNQGYRRLGISLPEATLKGVVHARKTLEAGVTTVRNVGAPGFADIALRDMIDRGEIVGPRIVAAGPPVGITGGHCSDSSLLPASFGYQGDGVADGPWALVAKVRRNIKFGADVIKTCSTGGVLSKGTEVGEPQSTVDELQAIVREAHQRGLKVASHAHGAEGIRNAIEAGVDSIEHASFIDDEGIRMAKRAGTVLVMDIYNTEYILGEGAKVGILEESLDKERRTGKTQRENFGKAHRAGVKMAMGTDAGVFPHGDNLRQLSRMVQFGMTPAEAIRAATINGAELLGLGDQVGRLEPGYYADFVLTEKNPLEDITTLEDPVAVIKGGEIVYQRSRKPAVEILAEPPKTD